MMMVKLNDRRLSIVKMCSGSKLFQRLQVVQMTLMTCRLKLSKKMCAYLELHEFIS